MLRAIIEKTSFIYCILKIAVPARGMSVADTKVVGGHRMTDPLCVSIAAASRVAPSPTVPAVNQSGRSPSM